MVKFISDEWKKSLDQRLSQLLINLGLIQDNVRDWNTEISDLPIPHEIIRNIQTWGTNGKGGKSKYKEVYIKDLETDHIKMIIKTQKHLSDNFICVLKNEIKFRKNKKCGLKTE